MAFPEFYQYTVVNPANYAVNAEAPSTSPRYTQKYSRNSFLQRHFEEELK
jgi:hypothetical protein